MVSQDKGRIVEQGAILVENGTVLPEPLLLENDSAATGWASVVNNLNGRQLEKELTTAGWTFFYMAGSIRTTAFGFEKDKMLNAAMKRVFASVKLQKCNCLEIDDVAMRSFLGMPYVSISAHSRHIQKGIVFSG